MSVGTLSLTGPLDVQSIVDMIIQAKRWPENQMYDEISEYNAIKSALQDLNSKVSAIQSGVNDLADFSSISIKTATVSDEDYLTAEASSSAQEGDYYIIVRQLARAQSDTSTTGYSSPSDYVLTEGTTFSITQNGETVNIDITGDTRSLNGLRDAINNSGLDVYATVIYDGSQYLLQVTSTETGSDYAFTIDDTGVGTNMATKITAQNALINVNTTDATDAIERSSNTIDDVIPGITLNLKKADATKTITLTVGHDYSNIESKVNEFISKFNDAINFLNAQFEWNEEIKSSGPLSMSQSAKRVQQELLSLVVDEADGLSDSATYKTLSSVGIRMNNDGTLELDTEKFEEALSTDFEAVRKLFEEVGETDNQYVTYIARGENTVAGTYEINITQPAERAVVQGDYEVPTTGIAQDEALTITYGGTDYTVNLTAGDTLSTIITKINSVMDENNVPVMATSSGNYLVIQTENYGSNYTISVVSNVSADAGGTGIGTTTKTDTGVDIAGTIGGYSAEGSGRTLTGAEGPVEGLKIYGTMTTSGSYGSVSLTFGVMSKFDDRLEELLSTTYGEEGPIAKEIDYLESNIEAVNERIQEFERQLEQERNLLLEEFTQANQALAQLQALQMNLTKSFTSIV